ncbi:transposase [Marinagarivorans algicola]|uniref:transposase n=1 Tax=Marinagarivorans algicola TaxID=1513270 RepID=UPI003736DEE9
MNKKTRPRYDADFRLKVANLVLEQDYSIRDAAEVMGVGKSTVDKWVRQRRNDQQGKASELNVPIGDDQQRIRELEKEIRRINEENDILKKASALLRSGALKKFR